jgi:hypothetical protein
LATSHLPAEVLDGETFAAGTGDVVDPGSAGTGRRAEGPTAR